MSVVKVNDDNFKAEVLESDVPVLVDFWAEWCGPCRMVAPVVEQIATDYGSNLKVAKVNVDENPGVANEYGIMSIPSLFLFKNGDIANKMVGFMPKEKLKSLIDENI